MRDLDGLQKNMTALGNDGTTLHQAQVSIHTSDPIGALLNKLGPGPFELVLLFVNNRAEFAFIMADASSKLSARQIVGCTTAGEIGNCGYEDDQIIAMALPSENFQVDCYAIDPLDAYDPQEEIDRLIRTRVALADRTAGFDHEFAFLVVDGLSLREDALTSVLSSGVGGMPLFGGSAGDGIDFKHTYLSLDGRVMENAAIVSVIRTKCPIRVFTLNHLSPTDLKMVVTDADPQNRIVRQINAEPAAREYARIVGKQLAELDQYVFAARPLVVQLGDRHHVRAINRVNEAGELVFFSAIDEGMVLTLSTPDDLASHLDRELNALSARARPEAILGCDCIHRRLEAGYRQQTREVSDVLQAHKVRGFGTYGEQIGALHVNHTMTGVAIYPPGRDDGIS